MKYIEEGGNPKVFQGNTDRDTEVEHTFTTHLNAFSFRIYPTAMFGWTSLRFEVKVCEKPSTQTCSKAGVEDKTILASSLISSSVKPGCNDKERWRLNAIAKPGVTSGEGWAGAWCGETKDKDGDYVGVKFASATEVSGVITQGREDYPQWVSKFKIGYTETDGGAVKFIQDDKDKIRSLTVTRTKTLQSSRYFRAIFKLSVWQYILLRRNTGIHCGSK